MSVASEISRIYALKEQARVNVNAKGRSLPPEATLEEIVDEILLIAGVFAPAALEDADWSITPDVELADVNIISLPSDGGSAITALQYRIDGGTPVSFAGTAIGIRSIDFTGADGTTAYDIEVRAVNAIGNGAWSLPKSVTPEAAVGGTASIVEELLTGSPFAFAIVAADPTISKFYTESTGASATTECVDMDAIGTIECVPLGTFITYPSGPKPIFRSSGGQTWVEMQADMKMVYEYGADYTGTGEMVLAFAGTRGNESGSVLVGAGNAADDPMWYGTTRSAIEINGDEQFVYFRGTGGQVLDNITVLDTEPFVVCLVAGETTRDGQAWKVGADPDYGSSIGTWDDAGGWDVRKVWLGSRPDEATVYVGRIHAAMVIRVDADSGQLADLASYLGALVGLTIP